MDFNGLVAEKEKKQRNKRRLNNCEINLKSLNKFEKINPLFNTKSLEKLI